MVIYLLAAPLQLFQRKSRDRILVVISSSCRYSVVAVVSLSHGDVVKRVGRGVCWCGWFGGEGFAVCCGFSFGGICGSVQVRLCWVVCVGVAWGVGCCGLWHVAYFWRFAREGTRKGLMRLV
jgi:hypothetical protein